MLLTILGGCLIGGGLKGMRDNRNRRRRSVVEHTPVYTKFGYRV